MLTLFGTSRYAERPIHFASGASDCLHFATAIAPSAAMRTSKIIPSETNGPFPGCPSLTKRSNSEGPCSMRAGSGVRVLSELFGGVCTCRAAAVSPADDDATAASSPAGIRKASISGTARATAASRSTPVDGAMAT